MENTYEWQDSDTDFMSTMRRAKNTLDVAQKEGLLTEVVVFALKYMKSNPQMTEDEAISASYRYWLK